MSRCATTHGHYRCSKYAGHDGDCEQHDMSGILRSSGRRLDEIGESFGIRRNGDDDPSYRARIWKAAS